MLKSKQTNVTILKNTAITCCGQNSVSLKIIFKRFLLLFAKIKYKSFFALASLQDWTKKFSFFYHAIPFLKNANKFDRMKEPLVVFNIFLLAATIPQSLEFFQEIGSLLKGTWRQMLNFPTFCTTLLFHKWLTQRRAKGGSCMVVL